MKKQNIVSCLSSPMRWCAFLVSFLCVSALGAQTTVQYSDSRNPKYVDMTVPTGKKFIYLEVHGGDGGWSSYNTGQKGGKGARVTGYVEIGPDKVPAGSTIRFIPGKAGESAHYHGGGGGGSAVAFQAPGADWKLLMVAGGGGGAGKKNDGQAGTIYSSGSNGLDYYGNPLKNGGSDGNGGSQGNGGYGGGGALANASCSTFSDCDMQRGKQGMANSIPTGNPGGVGGDKKVSGGFGFGSGGAGRMWDNGDYPGGGGGGGYSGGGGAGNAGAGGGGGSYLNSMYVQFGIINSLGGTKSPQDGYVSYESTDSSPSYQQIKFAYNTNKCMDDYASHTDNGTNIQTYNCHSAANQWWFFNTEDRTVRSKLNTLKCLDLDHSNVNNGTNIQLWDCNNTSAQGWLYNGIHKTIHSGASHKKCLDATNGASNRDANVNVQLWDCTYGHPNMRWEIAGATTVSDPAKVKYIIPEVAGGFAVHSHSGAKVNSNIQLWTKGNNEYEQWYFDGLAIKMRNHQDLCVDLYHSDVANGTNIQLYSCNGSYAQQWIYDGLTRTIRSVINQDKCMQFEKNSGGEYGTYSNVRIWDCNGSQQQQFLIQE